MVILWVNVEGNWILFVKNLHFFSPPKKLYNSFHRPPGAIFEWLRNFPRPPRYPRGVENCQKTQSYSKSWLWKLLCKTVIFFQKIRYFFSSKIRERYFKKLKIIFFLKKVCLSTYRVSQKNFLLPNLANIAVDSEGVQK